MVDLMQQVEFIKSGKDSKTGKPLYMIKDGDGKRFTEEEVKDMFRQNNKELQEEVKKKKSSSKKEKVKDETLNETVETDK